ncbi:DMT family transporter [Paractinoplanes toevensis]|uniref:DMT family transporter n=1 Tax=Paractinoplanes toevensis TaxID=571911 RepID=UPI001FE8A11B|nr:DMT family transporter [Actinoplanes toevensis]
MSAASYAGAAVAQERLAKNGQRGLTRWAVALVLTAGGVGLHVIALNFGTVAVVQALGTLTLLFALPISALRYRTRISIPAWIDAGLTVAGLSLIMSLSVESDEPALLTSTGSRYLSLVTLILVAGLIGASTTAGPRTRGVLLAAAAGVAFGISSVLSKAVMAAFADDGPAAVSLFQAGMVVLLGIGGYVLSQLSYRGAGLAAPLATVSVANPIVAAIAGVVVFNESFRFGVEGRVVVAVAAIVMTLGVIGLARRTAVATPSATDPADRAVPTPTSP